MNTDTKYEQLQTLGRNAAESIAEMVAALECDYDRLAELRDENPAEDSDDWCELRQLETAAGDCEDREAAEQRISEDPLAVEVRSGWHSPGAEDDGPEEFCILLATGGPATRIIGELDQYAQPVRARIQAQDWGTPWTDYLGDAISHDDLLTYCQQFYFGG